MDATRIKEPPIIRNKVALFPTQYSWFSAPIVTIATPSMNWNIAGTPRWRRLFFFDSSSSGSLSLLRFSSPLKPSNRYPGCFGSMVGLSCHTSVLTLNPFSPVPLIFYHSVIHRQNTWQLCVILIPAFCTNFQKTFQLVWRIRKMMLNEGRGKRCGKVHRIWTKQTFVLILDVVMNDSHIIH